MERGKTCIKCHSPSLMEGLPVCSAECWERLNESERVTKMATKTTVQERHNRGEYNYLTGGKQ